MSNKSLLISAAVFMVAFGALVTVLEHVRHPPATPLLNFTGIAGVYLGLCAVVEHVRWLYVPAVILLLGAAATQLRAFWRSGRNDDERPANGGDLASG